MAERTVFILGLVSCTVNLAGWVMAIMAEENEKQYRLGLVMLGISVFILAGMVIAEIG